MKTRHGIILAILLMGHPCCGPRDRSVGDKLKGEVASPPSIAETVTAMSDRSKHFDWLEEDHKPREMRDAIITKFRESNWAYSNWVDGEWHKVEWPPVIKTLDPLKVYPDGVNAVLMISNEVGLEKGYYVEMPHSSYVPMSESIGGLASRSDTDSEWIFKPVDGSVWAYTRTTANKTELLTPARP